MIRRRLGVMAFALVIVGSILLSNLLVMRADAAPDPPGTGGSSATVQFLDRAHILVQQSGTAQGGDMSKASGIYYNSDFNGGGVGRGYGQGGPKHVGVSKAGGKECVSHIEVKKYGDGSRDEGTQATADITWSVPPSDSTTNGCVTIKYKDYPIVNPPTGTSGNVAISFGQGNGSYQAGPVSSSITYFKNDDKTILQADADPTYDNTSKNKWHFVSDGKSQCNSSLNYIRQDGGGKPDFITKTDGGSGTVLADYVVQNGDPCAYKIDNGNINHTHNVLVSLTRPDANTPFANPTGANGTDDLCSIPTWGLRWLACPLLLTAQKAIVGMDKVLQQLLTIGAGGMFDSNTATGKAFLDAEHTFATIAYSLLIVVSLIAVAAQTLFGIEFLDPYTLRKVLPRLLAMVIFLVLLVPIEKFLVLLTDNLTNWSGDIVAYPFRSLGDVSNTGVGQIALQWFGSAAAFTFLDIGGVLSMAATMLLGIFVLILVLLGRKLLIMFALIVAPIGIVASILPNTRPLARFIYKDLALPAALAGPAIGFGLGLTIGFAHVAKASNLGGVGDTAAVLIIIFGEFLPLWIMKRIGGTVSNLTGMVNDRSRGGFDRLRNYRASRLKDNVSRLKTGDRFGETMFGRQNFLASKLNRATRGTTNVMRATKAGGLGSLHPGNLSRNFSETSAQQAMAAAAETMQKDGFKLNKENDDLLSVADYDSESAAVQGLEARWGDRDRARNAVAAAKSAGMDIGGQGFRIAAAMQRVSTGTGYNNMQDMVETLGRASGGNASIARNLAGFANAESKNRGRHDWAPGYGTLSRLTVGAAQGGAATPAQAEYDAASVEAALGTDNATLMRDKPYSVGNITQAMERELERSQRNLLHPDATVRQQADQNISQIVTKLGNMRASGLYAPEVNIQRMRDVTEQSTAVGQSEARITGRVPIYDAVTGRQTGTMNVDTNMVPMLDSTTGQPVMEEVAAPGGGRIMRPRMVPVPNGGASQAAVRTNEALSTGRMGGDARDQRLPF